MNMDSKIFKAYDIRGTYPDQLDEEAVKAIGQAVVQLLGAKKVVIGHDIRLSAETLFSVLEQGLVEMGCEVINCGLIPEQVFVFAGVHFHADASFLITSDDKNEYGLILKGRDSAPIGESVTISEIEILIRKWEDGQAEPDRRMGGFINYEDIADEYEDSLG